MRRLGKDETCARPKDIIRKVSRQYTIGAYNGATKIHLKDSTFYIKEYGELLSCGPYSFGNAVLNIKADDAVGLMTAYDQEIRRCNEVVSKAIKEALTEAAALEIALTTAKTVADDIITRYGLDIEATDAGSQRVKFTVNFSRSGRSGRWRLRNSWLPCWWPIWLPFPCRTAPSPCIPVWCLFS